MLDKEQLQICDDFIRAIKEEDAKSLARVIAKAAAYIEEHPYPHIEFGKTKDGQDIVYIDPGDMEVEENV